MANKRKKLNPKVLHLALQELDQHLLPNLQYAVELRRFLKKEITTQGYLVSEFGFKKFINVNAVGRTLGAGDACKLKILELIRKYSFDGQHIHTITALAEKIQKLGLSSNASKGGFGLPRSFCSKLMYVYYPDQLIPFDSYVLQSLKIHTGQPVKDLHQYYDLVNEFRLTYFSEKSTAVKKLRRKYDAQHLGLMTCLQLDPDKLFSWKLTDKYLWCDAFIRR